MASKRFTYSILDAFGTHKAISEEYYQYMEKDAVEERASALERWAIERIKNNIDVDIIGDSDIDITNSVVPDADYELCGSSCDIIVDFDNFVCAKNEDDYNTGKQYARRLNVKTYKDSNLTGEFTYSLLDNYSDNPGRITATKYSLLTEEALIERVTAIVDAVLQYYTCGVGKTASDFDIDTSLAVQQAEAADCPSITTYEFSYEYICRLDYSNKPESTVNYIKKNGTKIASTITLHVFVNGVEDIDRKVIIDVQSFNTVSAPNDAFQSIKDMPLVLLNSTQANTVKNKIEDYLKETYSTPGSLELDPLIVVDDECVTDMIASIKKYDVFMCSGFAIIPSKYAKEIYIEYKSEGFSHEISYDIVEISKKNHPELINNDYKFWNRNEDSYIELVEEVYDYIHSYYTNSDLFTYEDFDSEGAIEVSNECYHYFYLEDPDYRCLIDWNSTQFNLIYNGNEAARILTLIDLATEERYEFDVADYFPQGYCWDNALSNCGPRPMPAGYEVFEKFQFVPIGAWIKMMEAAELDMKEIPYFNPDNARFYSSQWAQSEGYQCETEYRVEYDYVCLLRYSPTVSDKVVNKGNKGATKTTIIKTTRIINVPEERWVFNTEDYLERLGLTLENIVPSNLPEDFDDYNPLQFLDEFVFSQIRDFIYADAVETIGLLPTAFLYEFTLADSTLCPHSYTINCEYMCLFEKGTSILFWSVNRIAISRMTTVTDDLTGEQIVIDTEDVVRELGYNPTDFWPDIEAFYLNQEPLNIGLYGFDIYDPLQFTDTPDNHISGDIINKILDKIGDITGTRPTNAEAHVGTYQNDCQPAPYTETRNHLCHYVITPSQTIDVNGIEVVVPGGFVYKDGSAIISILNLSRNIDGLESYTFFTSDYFGGQFPSSLLPSYELYNPIQFLNEDQIASTRDNMARAIIDAVGPYEFYYKVEDYHRFSRDFRIIQTSCNENRNVIIGMDYLCLLNDTELGIRKRGKKIAVAITATDQTYHITNTFYLRDYNTFPAPDPLPTDYENYNPLQFLTDTQIASWKDTVADILSTAVGIEFNRKNDLVVEDLEECGADTYSIDYDYICMVEWLGQILSYQQIRLAKTVTITNDNPDSNEEYVFNLANYFVASNDETIDDFMPNPVPYGLEDFEAIQFVPSSYWNNMKAGIVADINDLGVLDFIVTANNIQSFDLCFTDDRLIKYTYGCQYNIREGNIVYRTGAAIATQIIITDTSDRVVETLETSDFISSSVLPTLPSGYESYAPIQFLNDTGPNYPILNAVREAIVKYLTDTYTIMVFSWSTPNLRINISPFFAPEGKVGQNTVLDCSPRISADYYCYQAANVMYDDSKVQNKCRPILTSGAFTGEAGFVHKLLSNVQGDPYLAPTIRTEPAAGDGSYYKSTRTGSNRLSIDDVVHTGSKAYPQYFPTLSFTTLEYSEHTSDSLYFKLCIEESKHYAIGINVDDRFTLTMDGTRIAYKQQAVTASYHAPLFVFEIYIAKGAHLLKFDFEDYMGQLFGATLEIYDDIEVLFANYSTFAEKKAAIDASRVFSIWDYMYAVYDTNIDSAFNTRAYGILPAYEISAADKAAGWKLDVNPTGCSVTASKTELLGNSGFRIANHIIDEDGKTAIINANSYPGLTLNDKFNNEYSIISIFEIPSDLITNKAYYKTHPITTAQGYNLIYYDNSECADNTVEYEFHFDDADLNTEKEILFTAETDGLSRYTLPSVTSLVKNSDDSILSVAYTVSIDTAGYSSFITLLNNDTQILPSNNTGANARKNIVVFTQATSGKKIYLHIIQHAVMQTTDVYKFDIIDSYSKRVGCCTESVIFEFRESKNGLSIGAFVANTITRNNGNPNDIISDYISSTSVVREIGVLDRIKVIVNTNLNKRRNFLQTLISVTQAESDNMETAILRTEACEDTKSNVTVTFDDNVCIKSINQNYDGDIYVMYDVGDESKIKITGTIEYRDVYMEINSSLLDISNDYSIALQKSLDKSNAGQPATFQLYPDTSLWETSSQIDGVMRIYWGNTLLKRYYVHLLPMGSEEYCLD